MTKKNFSREQKHAAQLTQKSNIKANRQKQREMIREFDRRLLRAHSKGMEPVAKLGIYLFEGIITFLLCIPYEPDMLKMVSSCAFVLTPWPIMIYMTPYLLVSDGAGKMHTIYEKLRYLPVERAQVKRVRIEYLLRFLKLPFFLGMAAQLASAFIFCHRITLANVIYPLALAGVVPLMYGTVLICERRS